MSNANLRRFFSDINDRFSKGFKDFNDNTHEQIKMDIELVQVILEQIRSIKRKRETIAQLQVSIKAKNDIIAEFTEFISTISDKFKALEQQSNKDNCYLYSPYNNTKPLTSLEILNYAKKISHSLQAPRGYVPDTMLPANFVLPFPTEDNVFRSYLYFNSRTDGKVITPLWTFLILMIFRCL